MSYIIRHKETGLFFSGQGVPNYTINKNKAKVFETKTSASGSIPTMSSISFYENTLIHSICERKGYEVEKRVFFSTKSKSCWKVNINKEDLEIIEYEEI